MQHTTVLFVRHGESEGNVSGTWQGQVDTPLTALGRQQARLVAERIRHHFAGSLTALFSSDLQRAYQTAEAIAAAIGLPIIVDPRWRERNLGAWEGLTAEQIAECFPEDWSRFSAHEDLSCGGGESRAEVNTRVHKVLEETLRDYAGQFVCVVTHGGPIRGILARQLDMTWAQTLDVMPANPNTSLTLIEFHGERVEVVLRMDASHLEADSLNPTLHP